MTAQRGGAIPSLTGLRFLGALAVFVFHLYAYFPLRGGAGGELARYLFAFAPSWLAFFFLLSGFVLTWSWLPGDRASAIWRRRAARIFPSHLLTWLATAAALAVAGGHALDPGAVLPGLFLVQAWVPDEQVYFAVNTPAWSLSCEVAFYAAFPVLAVLLSRVGERWLWPAALLCLSGVFAVSVLATQLPATLAPWALWVFPGSRMLEFVLGMVLARIVRAGRWIDIGLPTATALVLVGYGVSMVVQSPLLFAVTTVAPLAVLIPAAATADLTGRSSPWRSPAMIWLGVRSYAFYLTHLMVIRAAAWLVDGRALSPVFAVTGALAVLAVAIGSAWCLHAGVERPMARRLAARGAREPVGARPAVAEAPTRS